MTPIIDVHQHLPSDGRLDARVETCRRAGIVKAVLLGVSPERMPGNNEGVLAASRAYPDLFVPFYGVPMERLDPDDLTRCRDQGFRGLKFIGPTRPYNDPVYFPLYERAAELKLPALFHLGIVANHTIWRTCDSNLMRPVHLDHIARRLPELRVIGAHFGNPWSDEAAMACRWNPNLFFDLSGSLLKYRKPAFLGELLWWRPEGPYPSPDRSHAWSKIMFGSDVESSTIADVVANYQKLLAALALPLDLERRVWYETAAGLLGLEQPERQA
jgi:hypothetical protein